MNFYIKALYCHHFCYWFDQMKIIQNGNKIEIMDLKYNHPIALAFIIEGGRINAKMLY